MDLPELRSYQSSAVESVFDHWKEKQSTLIVAATGTGKTETFCEVIRRVQPGRAMVLAHRLELVKQAVHRLRKFQIDSSIEMADLHAEEQQWSRTPVVVSSVQTQYAGRNGNTRMKRFDPNDFSLLIVDEAHHYTAKSYRKVLDYYKQNPNLKVLGVTATPDRADEQALG